MDEQFKIPVLYNGHEYMFPSSLEVIGYRHRFIVHVNGQEITFELDEDRHYRAIVPYDDIEISKTLDIELLNAIIKAIEKIFH